MGCGSSLNRVAVEEKIPHRLEDKNIRILQKQLTETSINMGTWQGDEAHFKPPLGRVLPPRRMSKLSPRTAAALAQKAIDDADSFEEEEKAKTGKVEPKKRKFVQKKKPAVPVDTSNEPHVTLGRAGPVLSASGKKRGEVQPNGDWLVGGRVHMRFAADGRISTTKEVVARIRPDGSVWDLNLRSKIGRLHRDGTVEDLRGPIGIVTADGSAFDARGARLGACVAGVAQSAFIFFFAPRIVLSPHQMS